MSVKIKLVTLTGSGRAEKYMKHVGKLTWLISVLLAVAAICSCMAVLSFAENEGADVPDPEQETVVYTTVKNNKEAKKIRNQVSKAFNSASSVHKRYAKRYKAHKKALSDYLKKYKVKYNNSRQPNLARVDELKKKIKKYKSKYKSAVSENDEKSADYYLGLLNKSNNELDEIYKTMNEDYEIFVAVRDDVDAQLKQAADVNSDVKKRYGSLEKKKNQINRYSSRFILKKGSRKKNISRIVDSANKFNSGLGKALSVMQEQIRYFKDYNQNAKS